MTRYAFLPAFLLLAVACMDSTSSNGGCTASATLTCVTIQDFTFSPASVTIKAGTAVMWTNNGPSSHTTTSDSGVWNSGALSAPGGGGGYGGPTAGGSYEFTFSTPGTYGYHCTIHPPTVSQYAAFRGTITVTK